MLMLAAWATTIPVLVVSNNEVIPPETVKATLPLPEQVLIVLELELLRLGLTVTAPFRRFPAKSQAPSSSQVGIPVVGRPAVDGP